MTTLKKRINITADKDIEYALIKSAKRDGIPVASKAINLLRIALDIEEDTYFTSIANERKQQKTKFINHESFWRK